MEKSLVEWVMQQIKRKKVFARKVDIIAQAKSY